jgi:hypothetical protein
MTAITLNTRASTTPALLRPSTLLLAAAIALEVVGVRALAASTADTDAVVASIDGASITAPAAQAQRQHVARVDVQVVAQSDMPAR